jgi:MFS family permease
MPCRLVIGIGSGVGLCVGPIYLAEITPSRIRGKIGTSHFVAQCPPSLTDCKGVLTQLGIVLGIMVTQAIGLYLATPARWRAVLFFSCALCTAQLFFSPVVSESPVWLSTREKTEESAQIRRRLWSSAGACGTLSSI